VKGLHLAASPQLLHRLLHGCDAANFRKPREITKETATPQTAAQTRTRRERPHPRTHGASRAPWGHSRLVAQTSCANGLGREEKFQFLNRP